jgi:hypothetical protein
MGILDRFPAAVRDRMSMLIVTALALFLALQYNSVISEIFETYFPVGEGLIWKVGYIILLTFVIVYLIVLIERAFGKGR